MILDARTSRHRNKVRLYAGPKFVARDGRWRHIRDVVKIERLAAAVYTVRFDDDWIRLAARGLLPPGTIEQSPESWRRFGPVIDTSKLAADSLRWDVTYGDPKAVERTPAGWRFKAADGVQVGVFLRDWIKRLGADKVSIDSGGVTLDVSHLRGLPGRLDLDPTVVASAMQVWGEGDDPWDEVHDSGTGGAYNGAEFDVRLWCLNDGGTKVAILFRTVATFDTSAYGDATAAVFKTTEMDFFVGEQTVDVYFYIGQPNGEPNIDPSATNFWYAYILTASGVWTSIGHKVFTGTGDVFNSGDVIGDFIVSANQYVIGIMKEDKDDAKATVEGWIPNPDDEMDLRCTWEDGSDLYWELTMPGGGGGGSRRTLTGAD